MRISTRILNSKYFGGRRWYQHFDFGGGNDNFAIVGERGKYRTESFVSFINSFDWGSSERIVDVGCNAGRYCFEVSKYVDRAVGIELCPRFYRQSKLLRKYYAEAGFNVDNVRIINSDIMSAFDEFSGATAVFLSKVLYHGNLRGLGESILETLSGYEVRRIIIQGHTTQGQMGQDEFVASLLASFNYSATLIDRHDEYPIMVAELG